MWFNIILSFGGLGLSDTGQDILIEDEITLTDLNNIIEDTEGRLAILEINGDRVKVMYRNFAKKSGKRYRDKHGAWELEPMIYKWVQLV